MPRGVYHRSDEARKNISLSKRGKWAGENNPKYGIHLYGDKNPHWKGGEMLDKDGYVLVKKRDHPRCNAIGYIRKHRLVYEEYHKCVILSWAAIHHINGIKDDNRIDNLELMSKVNHTRLESNKRRDPITGRFL
jgi:hypothetical protein